MKKQVILIAVAIILTLGFNFGEFKSGNGYNVPAFGNKSKPKPPPKPAPPPPPKVQTIPAFLEVLKKQLAQLEKIHGSITGSQKLSAETLNSFFLKKPESIYDNHPDVTRLLPEILRREENDTNPSIIFERIKHAATTDRAISLQVFEEAKNRFQQILELVKKINTTADLKSIAELRARIGGMLAMIQNEETKLQMVAHLQNAEQALIDQQKKMLSRRAFSSHI
ncbi:conjugal transfer protein [Bartonella tribocorum]|uniref:Conjugal transfer protein n=2 Tax=Bartonella tribocorum TaxID=85701 RepID=A0A2N9Y7V5_9HYPH|nr:conjugal transfer protein [Bartonella tribocorum]